MTSRIRTAALALVGVATLLVAPIGLAGSASAAETVPSQAKVVFFSNPSFTDPFEEDATELAALTQTGATVTVFDGGDGSGTAWAAALAGQNALVIPENTNDIWLSSALGAAGVDAILDFLVGGGKVVLSTKVNPALLSYLSGVDYATGYSLNGVSPWPLVGTNPALPAQLSYSDGTYPIETIAWSPAQFAAVTPLYANATSIAAASWSIGAGTVSVLAYDWFPGVEPGDQDARNYWNIVLQYLVNVPVPQLAATGSAIPAGAVWSAIALLMLGAAGVGVAAARRSAKA